MLVYATQASVHNRLPIKTDRFEWLMCVPLVLKMGKQVLWRNTQQHTLQFALYIGYFITKKSILIDMIREILGVDEMIYAVIFVSATYYYAATSQGLKRLMESNNLHHFLWDIITHPCPNFNGGLVKPPLMLGHGWLLTSHDLSVT